MTCFPRQRLAAQFGERALARINRLKETESPVNPRDVIAAILTEALPADDERRTFTVLYTAYFALSLTDPALAIAPLVRNSAAVIDVVAAQLRAAKAAADSPAYLNPDLEAVSLLAMSAGLGQSVLAGQSSPGQTQAVIDYNLDRLFPASRPALRRALVKVPATGLLRGPCFDGSMFGEQAPDSLLAGRRLHRVIKRSPAQLPQARRTRGRCARPAPDRYERPRRCPHQRDLGNGDAPALSARASSPPAGSDPPGIRGRVSCGHGRCPSRGRPRLGRHRRGGAAPGYRVAGYPVLLREVGVDRGNRQQPQSRQVAAWPAASRLKRAGSGHRPKVQEPRRARVRGWPAERTCPPLQPQA